MISKVGASVLRKQVEVQGLLQHRGYDSTGVAFYDHRTNSIVVRKGPGLVTKNFPPDFDYEGNGMISDRSAGHNRYGTSEKNGNKDDISAAHPITSEYEGKRVAITYNGNLRPEMRAKVRAKIPADLLQEGSSDTNDIADAVVSAPGNNWPDRFRNSLEGVDLAYAMTILTGEGKLFGLRCPAGTWPLWVGETDTEFIISSETRVEKAFNGKNVAWSEVKPGELVEVTPKGLIREQLFSSKFEAICSLHAIYGARRDSMMTEDGTTYGEYRRLLGEMLAEEHSIADVDLIVGIPDTALDIADGYADALGRTATRAIKKRDSDDNGQEIPRSYIAKDLEEAVRIVSVKFEEFDPEVYRGKRVLFIDETMIKSTTSKGVIQKAREAGAAWVGFLTASDLFTEDCHDGYVILKQLLGALEKQPDGTYRKRTREEIGEFIGADYFNTGTLEGMKRVTEQVTGKVDGACFSCVGGGDPLEYYREKVLFIEEGAEREAIVVS